MFFNNQQCIVLNIRDLTEQHSMHASSAQIKQLISVINAQVNELKESQSHIEKISTKIIAKIASDQIKSSELINKLQEIRCESKFTQLSACCMQAFVDTNY